MQFRSSERIANGPHLETKGSSGLAPELSPLNGPGGGGPRGESGGAAPPLGARNEERGVALSTVARRHNREKQRTIEQIDEKESSHEAKANEQAAEPQKLPKRRENQPEEPPDAPNARRLAHLMGCNSPLAAWKGPKGIAFRPQQAHTDMPIQIPCGRCMGCRVAKKQEWAIRATHEAQMHEKTCFITLTYSDQALPADLSLNVKHWQLFAKKLRNRLGPFRFLACGEYGDKTLRPHYHAILYGVDFAEDREPWKERGEHQTWRSPLLEALWTDADGQSRGFHEIGTMTYQSAAYVANYVTKKKTGDQAVTYERTDIYTGETWTVQPEFAVMSRRPGLGKEWFSKYWRDVYPSDEVVLGGKRFRPPKYYDGLIQNQDEKLWAKLRQKRQENVSARSYKQNVARDAIATAKAKLSDRKL